MGNYEFDDFYALLKIAPEATVEEIERAWLHGMKFWHPDKLEWAPKNYQDEGHRMSVKLNKAREWLTDPKKRERYDELYNGWRSETAEGPVSPRGERDEESQTEDTNCVAANDLLVFLHEQRLVTVDKRPQRGRLWVFDGLKATEVFSRLERQGFRFIFLPQGGRATQHKPSWYLKR
jgi:curved DNA-binding protein CbpA